MLVLGLNGSIRVEDALCGKKAGVHVSARMQARVHCVQNVIIARDDIRQRLLDVTDPVEEDYADLDVQTIILGLLANLTQELLGLLVDVHLRRRAGLVQHKHNVGRLGLALARERQGDLGLQVLVELGRHLLVLLQRGRRINLARKVGGKRRCCRRGHPERQGHRSPDHGNAFERIL